MFPEIKNRQFSNFNSAYKVGLQDIATYGFEVDSTTDPMSVGSAFGCQARPTKEIIGYSFMLESPADRLLSLKSKKINLPFAVANSLWTISGSDKLDFIAFYNSRGRNFSDNQVTLHGAHGKRLFDTDGIDQIEAIIERLRQDPYSRRTVAPMYHPSDNKASSKDIPCPIAIQFLRRSGKLHAITYMRSQSAAMVLPYDVYSFTFLHEALAVELGCELGTYHHVSGSFHYYLDEETVVNRVIAEEDALIINSSHFVPEMPRTVSPLKMVSTLMKIEADIRNQIQHEQKLNRILIPLLPDIPEYWRNLLFILMVRLAEKAGIETQQYITCLPEYFSTYFENSVSQ